MAGLLNVGEMASLALHALALLAEEKNREIPGRRSVGDMALELHASPHTLHKVVRRLGEAGFITSTRGPQGGLELARNPDDIIILDVVEAVDGKISANGCLFAKKVCSPGVPCSFASLTRQLEEDIHDYFATTSLSRLVLPKKQEKQNRLPA